jgi:hypothetical protein
MLSRYKTCIDVMPWFDVAVAILNHVSSHRRKLFPIMVSRVVVDQESQAPTPMGVEPHHEYHYRDNIYAIGRFLLDEI